MAHRTPTPAAKDGEGDYEVVTAAGERKTTSLGQRVKAAKAAVTGALNADSDTDGLATWPAQIADDAIPFEPARDQTVLAADATLVTGNPAVAPEQPPQALQLAFRRQHEDNTQRVAEQTSRRTAQLVTMDQHARARVYDIARLVALAALGNEAAAQLAGDGWANVSPALIGEFAAEIDGWRADRGIA